MSLGMIGSPIVEAGTDLDFLIPDLRMYIWDITEPYKYEDETLRTVLYGAIRLLGRKWSHRYLIDETNSITRNDDITTYKDEEPPVIDKDDEMVIVVQAAIILRSAVANDSSWDVASWKDDEVSYSNIQAAKVRDNAIKRDINLLEALLKRRLFPGSIQELPGFHPPHNKNEGII